MWKDEFNIQKEPFKFEYTEPTSDWYIDKKVEIQWGEYHFFTIEWRVSNTCWIVGHRKISNSLKNGWEKKTVGRINNMKELAQFVNWCKTKSVGNIITEFCCLDVDNNLPERLRELYVEMERINESI